MTCNEHERAVHNDSWDDNSLAPCRHFLFPKKEFLTDTFSLSLSLSLSNTHIHFDKTNCPSIIHRGFLCQQKNNCRKHAFIQLFTFLFLYLHFYSFNLSLFLYFYSLVSVFFPLSFHIFCSGNDIAVLSDEKIGRTHKIPFTEQKVYSLVS